MCSHEKRREVDKVSKARMVARLYKGSRRREKKRDMALQEEEKKRK